MEAAILNIKLASGKFGKANKIPNYIANCIVFFKINYLQKKNQ